MGTLTGETTHLFSFLPPWGGGGGGEGGGNFDSKEFAPLGKICSFKCRSLFRRGLSSREANGRHKSLFPFVGTIKKVTGGVAIHLKCQVANI